MITAKRPRGGRGRRSKATSSSAHASSGDEVSPGPSAAPSATAAAVAAAAAKKGAKKLRKWDADGNADEDDDRVLDYSAPAPSNHDHQADASSGGDEPSSSPSSSMMAAMMGRGRKLDLIDQKEWGRRTTNGEFVLKDLGEEADAILKREQQQQQQSGSISGGALGGFFRSFVGGKVLTREDLDKPLAGMREHLLKKNVAQEAANDIVRNVENNLVGQKTGSFQSIEAAVRAAVEAAIKRILTPTNSLDLLREIQQTRSSSSSSSTGSRPYVISVVGVNGVGKSTNLSKICFFLLQNKFKVLVAACDTFRSGAVEQLRAHVRNLSELSERDGGVVELFDKGYGKDSANVAKAAVDHAQRHGFDVVLIDTAGRRHNDARLMSSLEKFATLAAPDKILMVGEALVGADSVMQARNFNAAFGSQRTLDGFIISKCDTVGDMVCSSPSLPVR